MIEEDHLEFLHAVWTRRTPFTYTFFAANIAIFVLMSLAGGSMDPGTLMAFGVKDNARIDHGEIWRLVTPIFLHIGLIHLFFNSYALWVVGPTVEKLYGSERFVILYLASGVAGVLGSYFYHPDVPSAGASGAIFGFLGVLLVFGFRYRHSIPPFFKRAVGVGMLPVIIVNLVIGFIIPSIDISAHIAGLVAGALLAAILPFQSPGSETHSIFKGLQMALLAVVLISFYEVAAHYDGPRLSVRNLPNGLTQIMGSNPSSQRFIDAINNAENTFEQSAEELRAGAIGGLAKMGTDVSKSIDQLRRIPSLAARSDELSAELLRVMQDQYDLIRDIERAGTVTFAHDRRLKENVARYEKVKATLLKWAETDGQKYGIQTGKRR